MDTPLSAVDSAYWDIIIYLLVSIANENSRCYLYISAIIIIYGIMSTMAVLSLNNKASKEGKNILLSNQMGI